MFSHHCLFQVVSHFVAADCRRSSPPLQPGLPGELQSEYISRYITRDRNTDIRQDQDAEKVNLTSTNSSMSSDLLLLTAGLPGMEIQQVKTEISLFVFYIKAPGRKYFIKFNSWQSGKSPFMSTMIAKVIIQTILQLTVMTAI